MLEFATTGIARIAAAAGAEFAVFDMEHTGWSVETIRMLMAAAHGADIVPIVRVPTLQYHFIARVLDVGAMGVVIPLITSAEQARAAVRFAKYPPEGSRGVAFGVAHDDYRDGDLLTKMRRANAEIQTVIQIETAEAVDRVDEIAAVEGVDALWIGQFDLSTALGIPGQFDHPRFREATQHVLAASQRAQKTAVLGTLDVHTLCQGPSEGYRMLVYLADIWIYQQALRRCFDAIRDTLAP
jgi:2-dehydro-3-deoxyglucarate aldolase/4-hydroxy-2-oxoheptanedioate aldolase